MPPLSLAGLLRATFLILAAVSTFGSSAGAPIAPGCPSLLTVNLTEAGRPGAPTLPRCYCDRADNKSDLAVQINCVHLADAGDFANAVKSVSAANKQLREIHVRGLNFSSKSDLPTDFFAKLLSQQKTVALREITIFDCLSESSDRFLLTKKPFNGLEKSLKSLKIMNCPGLGAIMPTLRNLALLEELQLKNVNLTSVSAGDLDAFKNLKSLDLSGQPLTVAKDSFKGRKSLEILKLSGAGVGSRILDELKPLTGLKTLDLSGNDIRDLPDKSFAALRSLDRLVLNFNYVPRLTDRTFDGPRDLRFLDLRVNLISNISDGAFAPLPNLRELLLAGNYVEKLSAKNWQPANNLDLLDLGHNELSRLDGDLLRPLKKLRRLNLDKNDRLRRIEPGAFDSSANLRNLNLSFTNLTDFLQNDPATAGRIFRPLTNLVSLDLSGLNLDRLDKTLFAQSPGLTNVYLRLNKLKAIGADVLPALKNVRVLELAGNPWQCDARLRDLAALVRKISSNEKLASKLRSDAAALCASPEKVRGLPLAAAKIETLVV